MASAANRWVPLYNDFRILSTSVRKLKRKESIVLPGSGMKSWAGLL